MAVDVAGVAVGSAATLLVGVTGATVAAFITARREHGKWLREERFRAYVELLAATAGRSAIFVYKVPPLGESERDAYVRRRDQQAEQSAATARVATALAAVDVVGPPNVVAEAREFVDDSDPDRQASFVTAARDVLRSTRP